VTIEKDIDMLEKAGCDILFLPTVAEMYPAGENTIRYELGFIETVLEGKYRPGHFQGVCRIVDKLLNAVKPSTLYLGQKDYQQCMVINKMITLKSHKTKLQVCDTVREGDGLAMSSRNMRLSENERKHALHIIQSLKQIKAGLKPGDINYLKENATRQLEQNGFKVDYIEIADAVTLEPLDYWDGKKSLVALAAAFLNDVRLIDNLVLTSPQ
ncbi:MAG: 4-phosphopantoate--beta-alanine ligase, partial [Sphingobacteriales bacterium]